MRGGVSALMLAGIWLLSYSYQELLFKVISLAISILCLASCFLPLHLFDTKDTLT